MSVFGKHLPGTVARLRSANRAYKHLCQIQLPVRRFGLRAVFTRYLAMELTARVAPIIILLTRGNPERYFARLVIRIMAGISRKGESEMKQLQRWPWVIRSCLVLI